MAQLPIRNLRLRAFTSAELDRTSGSSGDIYYDSTNRTLRVYLGGGESESLARSDLVNVSNADFLAKATSAGFSVVGLTNGARTVTLDAAGSLIIPGDIGSEGNINIDINLADSTLRRWQFDEEGDLTLPQGGDVKNSQGQGIFALLTNYVTGASLGSTLNSYVLQNTGATGNIFTNLIDSLDSSAITVTPSVIFSSDVTVENDLRANGSRVITISDLQVVVQASADFADFKTRIAALLNN